jgi:hypothetical protein
MIFRLPRPAAILSGLAFCLVISSCDSSDNSLKLEDLTENEYVFIQRMVILERTKAVALIDKETGITLLDSLAVAWGDSALERTREMAENSPLRSAAVGELLSRILEAERDSLIHAPRPDRIGLPLSDPSPATHPEQSQKS